jgi:hypothetical protein
MATTGKIYGGNIAVDYVSDTVDIVEHDASTKGLKLGGTLVTSTAAELNKLDGVTATAAELNTIAGVTAGTAAASKAVVLDANKAISTITTATITNLTTTALTIGATAVGSTATEIDNQCDVSLNTETIAEGGVVSVTKRVTKVVSTGAGAITLAAPSAATLGMVKVIEMTGGEHDVTLSLTNVQGQSSGTTATFSDTNDALVLVAGTNKWHVLGESGIALS